MQANDPAETSLIHKASRGDAVAIDQLLAQNLPGLRAFIRLRSGKLLRAKESCSDLAQSVCREVLEDLAADKFEYRGEAAFRHWLFQQGLHKVINRAKFYSAKKRSPERELGAAAGGQDTTFDEELMGAYQNLASPSQEMMNHEAISRIEAAFDELPDDYREAITLHRLVGLPQNEIAEAMGRSEGAVRNLIYRGLARLSTLLETTD